jgi:hypothetical protein
MVNRKVECARRIPACRTAAPTQRNPLKINALSIFLRVRCALDSAPHRL